MDTEQILIERRRLLFGVRRSVRYHSRRRQFFDRYRLWTSALSIIFGSATIYLALSSLDPRYTVAAAAVVTVLSGVDLVIGSARMARLHEDLYRQFINLEQKIISVSESEFTEQDLKHLSSERLTIEANEPPIKRVLDATCHNELLRALGYDPVKDADQYAEIKWYQRAFAQFFDFSGYRMKRSKA